ncbi:MAG: porin [Candidatus Nitrotoga sp.]
MFKPKLFIVALGALLILPAAAADEPTSFLKNSGIEIGGWINGGITYNANNPASRFNGPVTFADRSKEFQLNQFNVYMQRAVATEGKKWDFGGRLDFMFGTDAIFAQAYGIPALDVNTGQPLRRNNWDLNLCCSSSRFYKMALPQAFIETYVPVGNGLNLKIGHFYSPTGYETVPAPDNFFYTRSYTFSNGEPFTHTGLVGNYTVNKNWAFMGGAVTGSATGGWDGGWDRELSNWGGLAGTTWTTDDKRSSVNLTGSYSKTSSRSNEPWGFYSLVLQHKITQKTLLVLHHTGGGAGGVLMPEGKKDVAWYGVDMQLHHDLREDLSVGVRSEWFRDKDGFRVCSPVRVAQATNGVSISYAADFLATCKPADYYSVTVGMNWKPAKQLKIDSKPMQKLNIRPNIRYDRVDSIGQPYRPFDNRKDQLLVSVDATIPF